VGGFFLSAAALAVAALLAGMLRKRWLVAAALLLAAASLSNEVRTSGELALQYAPALFSVICAAAFCFWFGRRNYLAYALVLGVMALRSGMMELLGSANAGLRAQGWMVAVVAGLAVVWAVLPGLRKSA
jgi:hypothetical protein